MGDVAGGPVVKCELRLEFGSEAIAEKVLRSVELDNQEYISTRLEGRAITANATAGSLNSLLHTLDDFLACTSVAEKMIEKKV